MEERDNMRGVGTAVQAFVAFVFVVIAAGYALLGDAVRLLASMS